MELLAPAGDITKLKAAIDYGADAVYLGGESFGMRKASKNFSNDQLKEGIEYAHERGKKVYVTLNIVPHEGDFDGAEEYVKELEAMKVDAVIVTDPGMFDTVKSAAPNMAIHMSTQGSITNSRAINFWHNMGAERVVLAREVTLEEIAKIKEAIPETMELEAFVHGAMCISYSGRCLISNYMTGRDANQGDCAHGCRYKYHVVEEKRPGQYFPIEEHEEGTFLFNSKDLCMIDRLDDVHKAGIYSLKLEGRVKSEYYVASIVRAYRLAIDAYYKDPNNWKDPYYLQELQKTSHRDYTTGFYDGKPGHDAQNYHNGGYIRGFEFVGRVLDYDKEKKILKVEQRNKIVIGDEVEIFGPGRKHVSHKITELFDDKMEPITEAPHPQQTIYIPIEGIFNTGDFIRMESKE